MAINFDEAILAHTAWKKKLRAQVDGTATERLDPVTVARGDVCDLGKWLQSAPREVRAAKEYSEIVAAHAAFHKEAAAVVSQVNKGDKVGAKKALELGSEFSMKSTAVVSLISKIRAHSPA